MPDREKVIKGLECHVKGARGCQQECPYGNENGCQFLLCADALELLKEQENAIQRNPVIVCPHCGKRVK